MGELTGSGGGRRRAAARRAYALSDTGMGSAVACGTRPHELAAAAGSRCPAACSRPAAPPPDSGRSPQLHRQNDDTLRAARPGVTAFYHEYDTSHM